MPRRQRWSDTELRDAVALSRSLGEVCTLLGLTAGGGTYASLHRHIARLGIDDGHLPRLVDGRVRPFRSWSDDDLREAVKASVSVAGVQRRLGYEPSGGIHRFIVGHIRRLELDTGHFDSWRGEPLPLALDHISGDPTDNRLENLRILCPNCHALTETWCGRNKRGTGRRTPIGREVRLRI